MYKKIFLLFILLAAGYGLLNFKVNADYASIIEGKKFNGSVYLSHQRETILSAGFGFANYERRIKNTPNTLFPIASITKIFTAAAILKLIDQGKLLESDTISTYLKPEDSIWSGSMPGWADQITIHQLLTHSSGLASYTDLPGFNEFYEYPRTTQELIHFLSQAPLQFEPGTQYDYSGAGYNLLGAIIEQVSGKSYGDYLAEEFFKPLGMDSTFASHSAFLSQVRKDHPLVAQGYYFSEKGKISPSGDINMSVAFAEASVISTTTDLYRWMNALFSGQCISKTSLMKMITPYFQVDNEDWMGYGIFINLGTAENPVYSHTGRINGFESIATYQPHQEISMILLSNEMNGTTFELDDLLLQKILKH